MTATTSFSTLYQKIEHEYINAIKDVISEVSINLALIVSAEETGYTLNTFLMAANTYADHAKKMVLPYIASLTKKVDENHNCSTCSGKCHVNHLLMIAEMETNQLRMEEALQHIKKIMSDVAVQNDKVYPGLLHKIAAIYCTITRLIRLEKGVLMPRIKHAQQVINVHA